MCVLPTICMFSGRRVCQHRIMGLFQRNHKSGKKLFSVSIFSLSFRVRKTWSLLPSASDSSSTTSDPDPTCSLMLLSIYFRNNLKYLNIKNTSSSELRELFAEYHLGRGAFRLCKRGTKYCGWDRQFPDFYQWRCVWTVSSFPGWEIIIKGTCVSSMMASKISTKYLQMEKRLTVDPGLETASLSLQGCCLGQDDL